MSQQKNIVHYRFLSIGQILVNLKRRNKIVISNFNIFASKIRYLQSARKSTFLLQNRPWRDFATEMYGFMYYRQYGLTSCRLLGPSHRILKPQPSMSKAPAQIFLAFGVMVNSVLGAIALSCPSSPLGHGEGARADTLFAAFARWVPRQAEHSWLTSYVLVAF